MGSSRVKIHSIGYIVQGYSQLGFSTFLRYHRWNSEKQTRLSVAPWNQQACYTVIVPWSYFNEVTAQLVTIDSLTLPGMVNKEMSLWLLAKNGVFQISINLQLWKEIVRKVNKKHGKKHCLMLTKLFLKNIDQAETARQSLFTWRKQFCLSSFSYKYYTFAVNIIVFNFMFVFP